MTCEETLEALLEADMEDLVPGPGSELGRHLQSCGRCRRAAGLIRTATADLDAWLDRRPAALDLAAVLDEALDEPAAPGPREAVAEGAAGARSAAAPGRARVPVRWGLPLAAAAALAALLLLEDPGDPPFPAGEAFVAPPASPGLALDVPADRSAAVLETRNPDITVVWFYGGD